MSPYLRKTGMEARDFSHVRLHRLDAYPEEIWHGGKINAIRPSVLHLRRGEIFNLEGKTFFAFGGARSHDIKDGILEPEEKEKIKRWNKEYKSFRINKCTWWEQEMPTAAEMAYGLENLKNHHNKVDYIITHCGPQNAVSVFSDGLFQTDELTKYFLELSDTIDFSAWFFGHYHDNRKILDRYFLLYEQIIRII